MISFEVIACNWSNPDSFPMEYQHIRYICTFTKITEKPNSKV